MSAIMDELLFGQRKRDKHHSDLTTDLAVAIQNLDLAADCDAKGEGPSADAWRIVFAHQIEKIGVEKLMIDPEAA